MIKIFFVICILFMQIAYCNSLNSNNAFEIELKEVPSGAPLKSKHGLSDGAISAIALGSTFGGIGILSGIGYCFLKHSKGAVCGLACNENCPYQLIDINNSDFITKSQHTYLIKAYEQIKKEKQETYKYLVIPDTKIKPNTYNTIFFTLPDKISSADFKIIQSSTPFNDAKLNTDIFTDDNPTVKTPTTLIKSDPTKGILIKEGKITKNKTLALTTLYTPSISSAQTKTYAIIVIFKNLH